MCARADWPAHKLGCKRMREKREDAVADWEASGGEKKRYNQDTRDDSSWYDGVPGLATEVGLLAWKHRSESPVVVVTSSLIFDAEGVATQVSVLPRSFWDEDPRFVDTFDEDTRERIRMHISADIFSPEAHYVAVFYIKHSIPLSICAASMDLNKGILGGVEIVEALTSAATTPEDLAAAIAFCKDNYRPIVHSLTTSNAKLLRMVRLEPCTTNSPSV